MNTPFHNPRAVVFGLAIVLAPMAGHRAEARPSRRALRPVEGAAYRLLAARTSGKQAIAVYTWRGGRFALCGTGQEAVLFLLSADHATPRGYRGPTSVALLVCPREGKILSASLVQSTDTPQYLKRLDKAKYFQRYADLDLDAKPFQRKAKGWLARKKPAALVDTVSGCTRTCTAVSRSVEATLAKARELLDGLQLGANGLKGPAEFQLRPAGPEEHAQ